MGAVLMKKTAGILAWVMLFAACGFFLYALHHPEGSFPWSNGVTAVLYVLYLLVMAGLFVLHRKK